MTNSQQPPGTVTTPVEARESLDTVLRRQAKSGKVSYADPVILHETSRSRVSFVPYFIPHSDHTELAAAIVTEQKAAPPMDFVVVAKKSVSLSGQAALKLLRSLKTHLKVAESGEDGDFIVIRAVEGTTNLNAHDPALVARALSKVLSEPEIAKHLDGVELSQEFVSAFRGAIRLKEMRSAVAALRLHLEAGESDERIYQKWCDAHSWAFGNAYVVRDEVRNISIGDKVDALLPTVIAGFRDLVELKRPDMSVLVWDKVHRNFYFSSDVSSAIGQCHRYLDILHDAASKGLLDHPEIVAYHPRAIVVIGRSNDWTDDNHRGLRGLNSRLNGITIMTYDQLLAQGERLVQLLGQEPTTEALVEQFDDDIPF
jgi:Domain of unknown function (DUF4263)